MSSKNVKILTNAHSRFAEKIIKAHKGEKGIVEPTFVYLPGVEGGDAIAKTIGVDFFSVPVELGVSKPTSLPRSFSFSRHTFSIRSSSGTEGHGHLDGEGLRVHLRIVRTSSRAACGRSPFGGKRSVTCRRVGVRMSGEIEPGLVVVPYGVDDERRRRPSGRPSSPSTSASISFGSGRPSVKI